MRRDMLGLLDLYVCLDHLKMFVRHPPSLVPHFPPTGTQLRNMVIYAASLKENSPWVMALQLLQDVSFRPGLSLPSSLMQLPWRIDTMDCEGDGIHSQDL